MHDLPIVPLCVGGQPRGVVDGHDGGGQVGVVLQTTLRAARAGVSNFLLEVEPRAGVDLVSVAVEGFVQVFVECPGALQVAEDGGEVGGVVAVCGVLCLEGFEPFPHLRDLVVHVLQAVGRNLTFRKIAI